MRSNLTACQGAHVRMSCVGIGGCLWGGVFAIGVDMEVPADTPVKTQKRHTMPKGDANPASRAALLIRKAQLEAAQARVKELEEEKALWDAPKDKGGGEVTAKRMKKVLGQLPAQDVGPTEKELRKWLERSSGEYIKRMREMDAEDRAVAAERVSACEVCAARAKGDRPADEVEMRLEEYVADLLQRFGEGAADVR